jgi:hypothetical protein
MNSFRSAAVALAAVCVGFGAVLGSAEASSAAPAHSAAVASHSVSVHWDDDSGWGGRRINDTATTAQSVLSSPSDSGWGGSSG